MKELSVFSTSTFSQILYCVLVRSSKKPNRTRHGKTDWDGSKSSPEYRNFDRIDGEPMEFESNIFPGFNTLQLSEEVKRLLLRLGETPENFTGRIIVMSMFNDISWRIQDNTMPPETYSNDFGGFLELISRFEFEFCRCGSFFF